MSEPEAPRIAIVTGASSGIGAATALELGRLGWRVALGARREDRLQDVAKRLDEAGGRAFPHALDVTDPASIERFFAALERSLGPADALVSNAGMSGLDLLQHAKVEDVQNGIAVNLTGPLLMARRALPAMLERRRGDLVFVSSENSVRPRPHQVGYSAAKAGLENAARALAMELEGSGVRSTIVRVGPTLTEFGARFQPGPLQTALAAWKYWGVQRHLRWMKPETVARAIVQALSPPGPDSHVNLVEVMPLARSGDPA
jgi:NAD(P)-dependent dehydrogenase (short-subunit alcohol dehydrogenase family)